MSGGTSTCSILSDGNHKISVPTLCNRVVLYVDSYTILSKYANCTDFINPIVSMSDF